MRVLVAGGTGAIGRRLVPALRRAGHDVAVLARSAERAAALGPDVAVHAADALDAGAVARAVAAARPDAIVHQLTSIPPRLDPRRVARDLAATNALRRHATRHLALAARESGVRRLVSQSIAFSYVPGETARTEDDPLWLDVPPAMRDAADAIATLESLTRGTDGVDGTVLRYGFFCGPGTAYGRGGSVHQDVLRRRVPVLGRGGGRFPFVHVDDAAAATVAALAGPPGTFNVACDECPTAAEWIDAYARGLGAPRPWRVPGWIGRALAGAYASYLMERQPAVSSAKARRDLGWAPRPWREALLDVG